MRLIKRLIIAIGAIIFLCMLSLKSSAQVITLGTQSMPAGTHDYNDTTVRIDGYLTGSYTFEDAHIVGHSRYARLFDTTINFINCTFEGDFSTAWNGANNNRPDNYRFLQKSIDICIANRVPNMYVASSYTYSQSLKVERVVGSDFAAVNLNIYGDGSLHNQRQTLTYTGTGMGLGVQLAKGGSFKGLWIDGNYQVPTATGAAFYTFVWNIMSGHRGIVIDYDGTRNNSGSSDFKVIDCNVRFFDVAYSVSPNNTTFNGDMLLFDGIRIHDCRVGFQSNQAQEKGNIIRRIESWGRLHTLFEIGVTGRNEAGDYVIESGNIAGEPIQLFNVVLAGYNSFKVIHLYAENIARIGRVNAFTSGSKMPASISVDVRLVHPSIAGAQTIFTGGHARTMLHHSVIRYYGYTGLTINMASNFSIFDCDFEFSSVNAPSAAIVDFEQNRIVLPRNTFVGKPFYVP